MLPGTQRHGQLGVLNVPSLTDTGTGMSETMFEDNLSTGARKLYMSLSGTSHTCSCTDEIDHYKIADRTFMYRPVHAVKNSSTFQIGYTVIRLTIHRIPDH